MKYRELTTESMGIEQKHIIIENDDGSFKSFPCDEENPEYKNFKENIKQYTKVLK
jgi:hypothetical protein